MAKETTSNISNLRNIVVRRRFHKESCIVVGRGRGKEGPHVAIKGKGFKHLKEKKRTTSIKEERMEWIGSHGKRHSGRLVWEAIRSLGYGLWRGRGMNGGRLHGNADAIVCTPVASKGSKE
ncbi:hypothetical protein U1Q18_011383 [Sarracenia purpurea var. burkii]